MTDILNDKDVRTITQTAGQAHLRTRGYAVMLLHSKVEIAVLIGPHIRGITRVGLPSSVARPVTPSPVISTKVDDLRNDRWNRLARRSSDCGYAVAFCRQCCNLRCRVKAGLNQDRCVIGAEMGRVPPRRIGLNFRKRLIRKRLNPPNAAACVKYDLLTGFGTARPSFNKIQLYRTSRIGGGDLRDLDGWFGRRTPRSTTGEQDTQDYERDNRSMLLEGGSVRGGAHTPPNVGNILLLAKPIFPFPRGRNAEGQGIDSKKRCSQYQYWMLSKRSRCSGR